MRFGILGPLVVLDGDRPVDLGAPKQRAVLAALLVSANRVVPLDRLIDELWGEDPPPAATGSLQAYVANLRRVLEPARAPRTPPSVLVTQAPGYLLRVAPADLDAGRFEHHLAEGRQLLGAGRPRAAHDALATALGLWRGRVLGGAEGYEFAAAETTRLDELRLAAQETHAEAALALGRTEQAVPDLERLVAEHPWRERPRELLMLALYRAGRRGDALGLMARTRREFADELGIDPGPALQKLHSAMLRDDPELAVPSPVTERPPTAPVDPVPAAPAEAPRAGVLVGRGKPLATVRAALDTAVLGRGRVVLVAGEPGIGKTRFLQELAAIASGRHVDVVWGRCHDTGATPPFWPWTQVLRGLAAVRGLDEVVAAARDGGPHLAPLVPELAGSGGVARPEVAEHARFLLYDAATRLLREIADRRPVLILLEDLHWADTPSLELVAYLAGQLPHLPVLLAATFRDEEVGDALATTLAALAREPVTERVQLTGLEPPEVGQMITSRTGRAVDERLADALHERTDGNPFFVVELARLLRSEGLLDDPGAWPVPETIRDVLRRRIARLPDHTVTLLTVGAVVGRSFDFDVLARVSGLDEEPVLVAVEAAVIIGLLLEHPELAGRYRFAHALVRETLYDGLSGMRRARLHARIGEALRALHGERDIDALAHHFWHAGPAVPAEQALACVTAAADAAERALAFERVIVQLRRAVTLIGRLDPGPDRDTREMDAQLALANLLVQTRGYAATDVEAPYARVRELARATSRTTEATQSLLGLAWFRCVAADYPTTAALGAEVMALARATGDREQLLAAHHMLGVVSWIQGKLELADAHLAEGVRLADEVPDVMLGIERPAVALRGFRSAVRNLLGDDDGAATLCSEALATAARLDHPYSSAFARYFAAHLAIHERDVPATRRWSAEAAALCEEHGFTMIGAMCALFDGWAAALQGEPGTDRIRAAEQIIEATGTRMTRHFHLGLRAEAELAEGRADDAAATLAEAFAESAATGECFYLPALRRLQALVGEQPP